MTQRILWTLTKINRPRAAWVLGSALVLLQMADWVVSAAAISLGLAVENNPLAAAWFERSMWLPLAAKVVGTGFVLAVAAVVGKYRGRKWAAVALVPSVAIMAVIVVGNFWLLLVGTDMAYSVAMTGALAVLGLIFAHRWG